MYRKKISTRFQTPKGYLSDIRVDVLIRCVGPTCFSIYLMKLPIYGDYEKMSADKIGMLQFRREYNLLTFNCVVVVEYGGICSFTV